MSDEQGLLDIVVDASAAVAARELSNPDDRRGYRRTADLAASVARAIKGRTAIARQANGANYHAVVDDCLAKIDALCDAMRGGK